MKLRKRLPLLLLLAAPCLAAANTNRGNHPKRQRLQPQDPAEVLSNDQILVLNHAPGDAPSESRGTATQKEAKAKDGAATARTTQTSRPYRGTEDAPVDGLDGKPHAGPFIDTLPEKAQTAKGEAGATISAKPLPTSLEKLKEGATGEDGWRLADIPEKNDGVMNDETRIAPKKGTTGTGGGISEKEKAKLAQGVSGEGKPQPPKEAPPLPHSEQERIAVEQEANDARSQKGKDGEKGGGKQGKPKGGEYGAGGYGMEKPTDLPEKPHNIPHPEPGKSGLPGNSKDSYDGPPVGTGSGSDRSSWLVDTMPETEGKTNPKKSVLKQPSSLAASNSVSSGGSGPTGTGDAITADDSLEEWFHSFVVSLTMIIFTEIGDKTFLIAALMAMRHPRLVVFTAAFSALAAMTILSAVLGHIAPALLPKRFTTFAAAGLFLVFGVRMLREGMAMSPTAGVGEEIKEVEAELEEKEHHMARRASDRNGNSTSRLSPLALEAGRGRKPIPNSIGGPSPPSSRSPSPSLEKRNGFSGLTNLASLVLSPAWVQTFIMTFLGEWGDRSQIATIAMAAGQDYWLVTLGAITGHAICTGLAVLGGRALAGRVSMRVVTIGGAVAFVAFGFLYLYECFTE